jgi:hypothetical protein
MAAGNIPNISASTFNATLGIPVYPPPLNSSDKTICSGTVQCRIPTDVWDSPIGGVFGSSFDDGPTAVSFFIFFQDTQLFSVTVIKISQPPTL